MWSRAVARKVLSTATGPMRNALRAGSTERIEASSPRRRGQGAEGADSQTTSYEYNGLGEATQVTYPLPSGTTWDTEPYATFTYDDAGLLEHFVDLRGTETQFSYTPDELTHVVTYPSTIGTVTTSYDNADNVEEVNALSSTLTYSYDYSPASTVSGETDSATGAGVSPSYDFDTLARVTKLTPGSGSATSYGYDQSGNLTTLPGGPYAGDSGTYDDASELTGISAATAVDLAYDADGNRLSETQGSSTLASGTWNGADELTSYDVDGGADMSAATYDGNGLRESDVVGSTTNHFVWDASSATPRLLEDHADLYIYGPEGTPVEELGLSGGTRKYLVADALGSVRAVISSSGSVLGTASYDAYGTPSGTGVSSNSFFGFAGGYTDATGLVYLVDRYYDPQTGQFLSVDPDVRVTGQSYSYARDDPVLFKDADGDDAWAPFVAAVVVVCECGGLAASESVVFNDGGLNAVSVITAVPDDPENDQIQDLESGHPGANDTNDIASEYWSGSDAGDTDCPYQVQDASSRTGFSDDDGIAESGNVVSIQINVTESYDGIWTTGSDVVVFGNSNGDSSSTNVSPAATSNGGGGGGRDEKKVEEA
jgi:RHS repeat-associated protein